MTAENTFLQIFKKKMQQTKIAILGAGFIADIHFESYHRFVPDVLIVLNSPGLIAGAIF